MDLVTDGPLVYILQSEKNGRFYIGCSANVLERLATHNAGKVTATQHTRPWKLVYTEPSADMTAARRREYQLKRLKSRKAIDALIRAVG